jgi:hypothetical protein
MSNNKDTKNFTTKANEAKKESENKNEMKNPGASSGVWKAAFQSSIPSFFRLLRRCGTDGAKIHKYNRPLGPDSWRRDEIREENYGTAD